MCTYNQGGELKDSNVQPPLFIGSSGEGLDIAFALQENLENDAEVTVWTQDIFEPSRFTLESLIAALDRCSFGVFVLSPDDSLTMRGEQFNVARDNVIFELGLFVGRLGRERSYVLMPRGQELHIPSDLLGVNPLWFNPNRQDGNLRAALGPSCNTLRKALKRRAYGTRSFS